MRKLALPRLPKHTLKEPSMGFIRESIAKVTGADLQADQARRNAQDQADATTKSAQAASKAAQEQAAQASRSMESSAARASAQAAAADAASTPVENPDVSIAPQGGASVSAKARRAKFGIGSTGGGVSI